MGHPPAADAAANLDQLGHEPHLPAEQVSQLAARQ
jgi:hypothetical protein